MSDMSFEQLLNEEGSLNQIRNGAVVKGTVLEVKENEIVVNIGYKSEGIITKNEYSNDSSIDLREKVHVGDEMEVKVVKVNDGDGQVVLSYKRLAQERNNKVLEEAYNNHEILKAKVTEVRNGGLSVTILGERVFIPASLVSDGYERDLTKYDGQEIEFRIIEFNPRRRRVIGDRKQIILERKAVLKEQLMASISEGMIVNGKVKSITDFGAFIDLGGADGLLHISEMSWGRIENPRKRFTEGQEVEAYIKSINGEKIALSMKFPDENPWNGAEEKFAVGRVVTGKVARMTDFGAFVELEPGVDALLHVSQISRNHVEKPSDVLSVGETVEAKIVEVDFEGRKISLSRKVLESAEAADAEQTEQKEDVQPEAESAGEDAPETPEAAENHEANVSNETENAAPDEAIAQENGDDGTTGQEAAEKEEA